MSRYDIIKDQQANNVDEANPLLDAVIVLMDHHKEWKSPPNKLLEELRVVAKEMEFNTKSPKWPKIPSWLVRRLRQMEDVLEINGIKLSTGNDYRTCDRRYVILQKQEPHISASDVDVSKLMEDLRSFHLSFPHI